MVAIATVVLVAAATLAVDLGMQRVARRDMQSLADGVALDLARLIDGRSASEIKSGGPGVAPLEAAKDSSVARNQTATLGEPPVVTVVRITRDVNGNPVRDAQGGVVEVEGSGVPDAVYVTASTSVDFGFAPGSGGAVRTAIGASESIACFRLGSFAAAVDSSNANATTNSEELDKYLNDALDLSVVSYQGLANAQITLGGLAAELGVGSVEELAQLQDLSLHRLFLASATVLSREGGEAADVTLLRALSATVMTSLVVDVDQLIELSSGGAAAMATRFDVLGLVAGAGFVANGTNFLDVGVLWNVPKFSSGGGAQLQIIEKAQPACGKVGKYAETAQLRLEASPQLNVPTIFGLSAPPADVWFVAEVASAKATLTSITCGEGTTTSPEAVQVELTRAPASVDPPVNLSIPIHLTGEVNASDIVLNPLPWGLLVLLTDTKATVDLTVDAGVSMALWSGTTSATYAVPPHDYSDPERVGAGTILVPRVVIDSTDFSGTITINGVVKDLSELDLSKDVTLTPIIDDLNKQVLGGINEFIDSVNARLTALTEILGIQAAGADLYGIPRPSCNSPALRG